MLKYYDKAMCSNNIQQYDRMNKTAAHNKQRNIKSNIELSVEKRHLSKLIIICRI